MDFTRGAVAAIPVEVSDLLFDKIVTKNRIKFGRRRVFSIPLDPPLVCFLRSEISHMMAPLILDFSTAVCKTNVRYEVKRSFLTTQFLCDLFFSVIFILKAKEMKRHQSYKRNVTVLLDLGIGVKISLVHR